MLECASSLVSYSLHFNSSLPSLLSVSSFFAIQSNVTLSVHSLSNDLVLFLVSLNFVLFIYNPCPLHYILNSLYYCGARSCVYFFIILFTLLICILYSTSILRLFSLLSIYFAILKFSILTANLLDSAYALQQANLIVFFPLYPASKSLSNCVKCPMSLHKYK